MSSFDEFIEAVKSQNYEIIDLGLKNENISVSVQDKSGKSAVEYAVDLEDTKILSMLSVSGRFDLQKHICNGPNRFQMSPVKYAAFSGKMEALKYLIKLDKEVDNLELLFVAAKGGNLKIIKWLIDTELVDPHCRNSDGENVLFFAVENEEIFNYLANEKHVDHKTIFAQCDCHLGILAAKFGQIYALKRYLDEGGEIDKPNENGSTPLLFAISQGHSEAVKFLVQNGANIDATDNEGNNSLCFALEEENEEILKALDVEKNREMISDSTMTELATYYGCRRYNYVQKRFCDYFLYLMSEKKKKEILGPIILRPIIELGKYEYLEEPFKLAMKSDIERDQTIVISIYDACRGESLPMLKEIFRLWDEYGKDVEIESENLERCYQISLLECLVRAKMDFIDFLVNEKGFTLDDMPLEAVSDERVLEFFMDHGRELDDQKKEELEKFKASLKQFEKAELAKGFDPESIDSQLTGLEGAELEKKVRFLLNDAVEKELFYAVKHILEKWKPSVKAEDYPSYPVNVATKTKNIHIVRMLCEYGFSVNVFDSDDAFVLALKNKDTVISEYIFLRGLILNLRLESVNEFPFVLVTGPYAFEYLAARMYQIGANLPTFYATQNGANLLHLAVRADMIGLINLIQKDNFCLNFKTDNYNASPCHYAFAFGCYEVIVNCIDYYKYFAVSITDIDKNTPIDCAIISGYYEMLIKLQEVWPELNNFIDVWEEGTFKSLYAKHKPMFCMCGIFETPQSKSLDDGTCDSCSQKIADNEAVKLFSCGALVHASCLQPNSPKCPACGSGPVVVNFEKSNAQNEAAYITVAMLQRFKEGEE